MKKLMVIVTRFLFLCTVLLILPAIAEAQSTQSAPGWYKNSGPSTIYEDSSGLKITWENSYIYQHPGNDNLYWYAQVVYSYTGSQTFEISCAGEGSLPPIREHMRGTPNSGYFDAEETLCDRDPNFAITLKTGEAFYDWAIFHNVPWLGSQVSLEWQPYGFSQWVDPWQTHFEGPPPVECPPELVTFGTCQHDACVFRHDLTFPIVNTEVGHVAWGWKISSDPESWVFGSTDSVNGLPFIPPFLPNGSWSKKGSFSDMIGAFRSRVSSII